jgi:hypothetical protein
VKITIRVPGVAPAGQRAASTTPSRRVRRYSFGVRAVCHAKPEVCQARPMTLWVEHPFPGRPVCTAGEAGSLSSPPGLRNFWTSNGPEYFGYSAGSGMNLKLLIDGIVQQTIVLIAQLSTASGGRAPLAHVADQVFLELARAIEKQGVRRQVVADMFGLALRSYTKKVERLSESASVRDRTLWEAVVEFIAEHAPTRRRVLERFAADGQREVVAVLTDLQRSGLIYTTGRGGDAVFGLTSDEVRERIARTSELESVADLIWLKVFRHELQTVLEVHAALEVESKVVSMALEELTRSGRIDVKEGRLQATNFVVPLGAERGWEAAVLDHYKTVAKAIATKVRLGATSAHSNDAVGGSTFTFTVDEDHPYAHRIATLFPRFRSEAQTLWDEVAAYNQAHPPNPDTASQVHVYLGQTRDAVEEDATLTESSGA